MRYQRILMERISDEEEKEREEIILQKEAGIITPEGELVITRKAITDYIRQTVNIITSGLYICLIFIGILVLLNPSSRDMILKLFL